MTKTRSLLHLTTPFLVEAWLERPEEINAQLGQYVGRPFHVSGIAGKRQEEPTYSVVSLACLHWGAVMATLNLRALPAAKVGRANG